DRNDRREERQMATKAVQTIEYPAAVESRWATMAQGDLGLLLHPVAQELLQSRIPARVAYIAVDGSPRVVPMQFHWTGEEFVVGCWPDDPKAVAICQNQTVALTIDTAEFPFRVLQVRGRARVSNLVAPSEEMLAASIRYMGPEAGQAWVDNI